MKKLIPILLVFLLFCGCADGQVQGNGYTFTDDLGRTVTVDRPQRVASLLGSFTDVWLLAGGQVVASADDAWEDFGLDLGDAVNLGGTKSPSLEALLQAQPDFVLASANTQADLDLLETLEAANIPCAYFNVSGFDDYLRLLKICTDITSRPDLYEAHGTALRQRIDDSVQRVRDTFGQTPPKVLYLRFAASTIRAKNSRGSVLGEMLAEFGCVNIADSDETMLENLSLEHILAQDPDFIFLVPQGDDSQGAQAHLQRFIDENPAWQELTAVRDNRVFTLEKRLYSLKPNALWADAFEELEEIICENTP